MSRYIFFLSLFYCGLSFAAPTLTLTCNYCGDAEQQTLIHDLVDAGLSAGKRRIVVIDMGYQSFNEFSVFVPKQDNPVFGDSLDGALDKVQVESASAIDEQAESKAEIDQTRRRSNNAVIRKIPTPGKNALESLLREAKSKYDEAANRLVENFIVLPGNSPYRSAYDALAVPPAEFNRYITHIAQNELDIVESLLKEGQAAIAQLESSLQVGVSALISASVSLQRDITGRVQFPDGSYVKVKIKLQQDIRTGLELDVAITLQAYDANDDLLPINSRELSNYSGGNSFDSGAFGRFLKHKGIRVIGISGGGADSSCSTDWSCDATGESCTLTLDCP